MKTNWFIATGLLAVAVIAFVLISGVENRKSESPAVQVKPEHREPATPGALPSPAPIVKIPSPEIQPVAESPKPEVSTVKLSQTNIVETGVVQAPKPKKSKPPIQDPVARVALSLVGADPDAEEYWFYAINDPSLSESERQDLIEDLNEDGLSDPKHPGPQDMPLILSRIRLIERLAPFSMDKVNADAFAEAYKDLINLADGRPAN